MPEAHQDRPQLLLSINLQDAPVSKAVSELNVYRQALLLLFGVMAMDEIGMVNLFVEYRIMLFFCSWILLIL